MKIAVVAYHFAEYTFRLVSSIAETPGVDLHLWCPRHYIQPYQHHLSASVKVHPFDKPRLRHALRQLRLTRRIVREIYQFDPDVTHVQNGFFWLNFGLPFLRRYPLVLTIHDLVRHVGDAESNRTPQALMEFGFHQADHLIVHSDIIKQAAIKRLHVPTERLHVIPHLALGEAVNGLNPPSHPAALFFGRIYGYKGLDYLIRAEPLVTRVLPDTRFIIAGTGEDFQKYRDMMVNPEHFILYNEFIPEERLPALFNQASVVVLPYIEASQSGVIAHAYTFSKPVIATTVGGLPEMVDHGQTGLLIPPRDEQALARALIELLQDPERCRQMGQKGRVKIDTDWSPQTVAQQTMRVYREAVNTKSAGKPASEK